MTTGDVSIFTSLKDRDLRREGIIIGEGRFLIERIAGSCVPIAAAAVPESLKKMEEIIQGRCPIYELSQETLSEIAGYDFHRGMLLAAKRPEESVLTNHPVLLEGKRLLVCAGISDPENLGSIIRSALALGWDGIILDRICADPFGRKALRCSMGASLLYPLIYFETPADLGVLKEQGWTLVGAVLNDHAGSPGILQSIEKPVLIFGNEGFGLSKKLETKCDLTVYIPQLRNEFVDSLNVAAAAAILLWEGRPEKA